MSLGAPKQPLSTVTAALPASIPPALMPHQVEGIRFLERANGRAMLADEAGLGKSRTTIEWIKEQSLRQSDHFRTIIITTKSFSYGWKEEFSKWWPEATVEVTGRGKDYEQYDVIIVTYDKVWRQDFGAFLANCVVLDESHKAMNADAKRSQAVRRLCASRMHVIALTGTPMPNGQPRQLWHQLLLVFPRFLTWRAFAQRFCDPKQVWAGWAGRFVWDYSGSSNEAELRAMIAPRFLQRTKAVLQLPPLTTQDVLVPVKTPRKKSEAWGTYAARLAGEMVKHTITLVDEVLERGGKVIVFTSYQAVRDAVWAEYMDKTVGITAGTPPAVRQLQVKKFQEDPATRVFVATTQIASEGITLTAADTIIFNDLPWSPGALDQAQSRPHRKGQTRPVHAYYMQSDTPFGRLLRQSLRDKQAVTEAVLKERLGE